MKNTTEERIRTLEELGARDYEELKDLKEEVDDLRKAVRALKAAEERRFSARLDAASNNRVS